MTWRTKKIWIGAVVIALGLGISSYAYAQGLQADINQQLQGFAGQKGANLGESRDPRVIAASLIKISLGVIGTIAVVFAIAGGFMIMTSNGNEEKMGGGKKILLYSVIGLVIILGAYSIVYAVYSGLYSSLQNPMTPGQDPDTYIPPNDPNLYDNG